MGLRASGLVVLFLFSYLTLMVETIGEAMDASWKLKARCAFGKREGTKSIRECLWQYDIDMMTLVATRGRAFPLSMLNGRLKCPRCGSTRITVVYLPPSNPTRQAATW